MERWSGSRGGSYCGPSGFPFGSDGITGFRAVPAGCLDLFLGAWFPGMHIRFDVSTGDWLRQAFTPRIYWKRRRLSCKRGVKEGMIRPARRGCQLVLPGIAPED